MHKLSLSASPTITFSPRPPAIPQLALAASALALSITLASTATASDFSARLTLMSPSINSSKNTNAVSLLQQVAVIPEPSWLETTIDRLLAQVPDDEWDKLPPLYVSDIDKRM